MAVIVRYGEIALKGKNRGDFERRLVKNMKKCLEENNIEFNSIKRFSGRILIDTENECKCLSRIFGIHSFSLAQELQLDLNKIKETALEYYKQGTFRISTQRVEKLLKNSNEINMEVGAYVVEKTKA